MQYKNREEAAQQLAKKLIKYKDAVDTVILALPRGGIVTASVIANELHLPLDILAVRKISAPFDEEFAIGAVSLYGEASWDKETIDQYAVPKSYLDQAVKKQKSEAQRREDLYRVKKGNLDLTKRSVILVDDGIATGNTMIAAINAAKSLRADRIIVAIPVIPKDKLNEISKYAEEVVYLDAPILFSAVGSFYQSFPQVSDDEVTAIMKGFMR